MTLIDEWKTVVRQAWSLRFGAITVVLVFMQAFVPTLEGLVPERTFAILSGVTAILSIVARLIAQPAMHPEVEETDEPLVGQGEELEA